MNSNGAVLTSAVSPVKALVDLLLPGQLEMLGVTGGIQVARPIDE